LCRNNRTLFEMALCCLGPALLVGLSRDRFPVVSVTGDFSLVTDGTMCPGVDSAPKNEYQGFIPG